MASKGDLWALVDAALDEATSDRPDELRARRDGIVDRLYAATAGCSNCGRPPPVTALVAAGLDRDEVEPACSVAEAEADAQAGGVEEQADAQYTTCLCPTSNLLDQSR